MILLSHTTYECPIYCNTNSKITIYRDSHTNRPLIFKLTNYDGESISYDSIGNPTSYRGATLTWQKGRQLASYTTSSKTLNFKYNIDGLRTQKKVGSTTYSYIWSSGLLMQQSDGTNTLKFSYSPDGRPLGVVFNGTNYYYIYNLQGDVIGLYNNTGTVVVEYTYDSWGKLISKTGSLSSTLGNLNPFRYRGYIYDEETGLYWLRSRYYDPETGRFLNADSYVSTGQGLNSFNMFAYCGNNPVKNSDMSGEFFGTAIGAIVGGIAGGITAAINGDNILAGIGIGAATGAIAGFAVDAAVATGGVAGIVIAGIGGAIASGLNYVLNETINDREIDSGMVVQEMVIGGVSNVLSFGIGGGTIEKVGGNVIKNIINNAKDDLLANTTRFVCGKVAKKTTAGIVKNVAKNILREFSMAGTETFCSSYASEVISYVFVPQI